ncbi:hypothetical protein MPH_05158 [Macrophomina phaseolina MS6]|uniref:Transmembrane protein n=1 Tax=Macrophomina phaseolina (strain MS6) TaxID=1126212 RepID=K2S583_MACPH|nr:hypothetical protein MPH_05158 [Macrophomina phaseolina MS6]
MAFQWTCWPCSGRRAFEPCSAGASALCLDPTVLFDFFPFWQLPVCFELFCLLAPLFFFGFFLAKESALEGQLRFFPFDESFSSSSPSADSSPSDASSVPSSSSADPSSSTSSLSFSCSPLPAAFSPPLSLPWISPFTWARRSGLVYLSLEGILSIDGVDRSWLRNDCGKYKR